MKHKTIILVQVIFLVGILLTLYILYPKMKVDVEGNKVEFKSINANVIIMSSNPDFSNPRYFDIKKGDNVSFKLKPGKYYWKTGNGLIESLENKFEIKSEVGLKIEEANGTKLVNVGNVKVNVTKDGKGGFVGRVILEPDNSQDIENNGTYTGEQYDG